MVLILQLFFLSFYFLPYVFTFFCLDFWVLCFSNCLWLIDCGAIWFYINVYKLRLFVKRRRGRRRRGVNRKLNRQRIQINFGPVSVFVLTMIKPFSSIFTKLIMAHFFHPIRRGKQRWTEDVTNWEQIQTATSTFLFFPIAITNQNCSHWNWWRGGKNKYY